MYGVDVPGCGKGNLTPTCNFGSYIDTKIWGPNHMLKYNDPEGYEVFINKQIFRLVTTLDAIFNTYMGL